MHTRVSNYELVEPKPEPERTLNRRLRRRNRRVPFNQRNNPTQHPIIFYPPILNINYFRHFFDILQNYDPIDDEPMWAADRVVALTPGSKIIIPETVNEFAIKGNIIKIFYHGLSEITQQVLNAAVGGIFLYKTPNQAYQLLKDKVLLKLDWAKNKKTKSTLKKTVAFADKVENILVEVGKFTFPADFIILEMEEDSKVPLILGRPFLHTADAVIQVKQKKLNLGVRTERMIFNIDSAMKHSYSNDGTCFSINVIDEILKEDFDALLDKGSKILQSIEGTLLKEEIFVKFDEFMAITADENSDSESDTEEPPFE
ncbi:reverse transcriptase domain-containing protein [Tanacetum coccineum]